MYQVDADIKKARTLDSSFYLQDSNFEDAKNERSSHLLGNI